MKRGFVLGVLFAGAALSPVDAPGCGPMFQSPDFIPAHRPGVAMREFYDGKLGVISGGLWLEYLIPAWRQLNGKPFGSAVLKSFSPAPMLPGSASNAPAPEGLQVWTQARSAVVKDAAPERILTDRKVPGGNRYQTYPNCLDSSFETAAETLRQRSTTFDAQQMAAWVKAQDVVFANCSDGNGVPADPEPGLPALLNADREYQIASAHFYAGRFDEARSAYLHIGKDALSPWKNWGPYLAAPCLIRKATVLPILGNEELQKAEEEMLGLARSSPDARVKQSARGLADLVASRLRPGDALAQIANKLADPKQDADFDRHLREFDYVWMNRGAKEAVQIKSDLYDWILTIRGLKPVDSTRALSNEAFLVAALVRAEQDPAGISELLESARGVKPSSPAYPTVAYQIYRLTEKQLDDADRRKQLDTALTILRRTHPRSAWSPFLAKRMPLAVSFAEFRRLAPRAPVALAWDGDSNGEDWRADLPKLLLDEDAARVFNEALPLSRWREAAEAGQLTPHLKAKILRAAWARAVVLGDQETAAAFAPKLGIHYPELKALAKDNDAFAAVYLLLHAPAVQPFLVPGLERSSWDDKPMPITRIDSFRRNWWCAGRPAMLGNPPEEKQPELRVTFLNDAELAQGAREYAQIRPNFFVDS